MRAAAQIITAASSSERPSIIRHKCHKPERADSDIRVNNNIGLVLWAQGNLVGAKVAHERALKIFETSYGPDHPNVATCINNLDRMLQVLGHLAASYERALAILEEPTARTIPTSSGFGTTSPA